MFISTVTRERGKFQETHAHPMDSRPVMACYLDPCLRCCFASDKVPKNPENKTGKQNSYISQLQFKAYTVKVIQTSSAGWDGCQCENSKAFQEYPFNDINHIAFWELHYIQYILGWPLEVRKQHIAALSSNNIAEIGNLQSLKATQDQTQPT